MPPRPPQHTSDDTKHPPFETRALRIGLRKFLETPFTDPHTGRTQKAGSFKFGVYAFFDYDNEPIYVGQTREKLSGRISRHLTNQRTDAVAMNVLDPFEVYAIEIWPLPQYWRRPSDDPEAMAHLRRLEYTVYEKCRLESKFSAVLNEKLPPPAELIELTPSLRGAIVSDEVRVIRGHPDTRIARRSATISRLAQIISERKPDPGLRRTLVVQAKRLVDLAERRLAHFELHGAAHDSDSDESNETGPDQE